MSETDQGSAGAVAEGNHVLYPRGTLWLPGPWDREPDRVDFEHAGLTCQLSRAPRRGFWRGYVLLPHGHRLHHAPMHRLWDELFGWMPDDWERQVTWSYFDPDLDAAPADAPWFVGFDCCHGSDISPLELEVESRAIGGASPELRALLAENALLRAADEKRFYRTVDYTRRQTELLAEGLR